MHKIKLTLALLVLATIGALAGIGTVNVGISGAAILPADSARRWIVLQNNGTTDVFVKFDSSTNALTAGNGVKIAALGGTLSIAATGQANPSRNAVIAISGTGTNALVFQEGNEN